MEERFPYKEEVGGSIPSTPTERGLPFIYTGRGAFPGRSDTTLTVVLMARGHLPVRLGHLDARSMWAGHAGQALPEG